MPDVTVTRPTQLSIVEGMERPVGPILPSVFQGTNADLMAAVAPLYLTGSVLDVTHGNGDTAGGWWRRFTPDPFTFHDLAIDGVDFTDLPHIDGEFDTVTFDPPYVLSGGAAGPGAVDLRDRFGLEAGRFSNATLHDLILGGLAESLRVASGYCLVKCMEYAQGGKFHDVPTMVTVAATAAGWTLHDRIVHHTGTGPGSHNIKEVKRARRHHSYLIVFSR